MSNKGNKPKYTDEEYDLDWMFDELGQESKEIEASKEADQALINLIYSESNKEDKDESKKQEPTKINKTQQNTTSTISNLDTAGHKQQESRQDKEDLDWLLDRKEVQKDKEQKEEQKQESKKSKIIIKPKKQKNINKISNINFTKKDILYLSFIILIITIGVIAGYFTNALYTQKKPCRGSNIILSKIHTGDNILLDINDTNTGKRLSEIGYLDPCISNLLYYMVKPNDVVIDVGSSYGYYTIYLSRIVGEHGIVYSVESDKYIYNLMTASLRINRIHNVKSYNQTLFSHSGHFAVYKNRENSKKGIIQIVLDKDKAISTEPVLSIDKLFPNLDSVKVIHINARGNEVNIIAGANKVISRSPDIKIITSWYKNKCNRIFANSIIKQMFKLNLKFWSIDYATGNLKQMHTVEEVTNLENGSMLIARSLK